MTGRHVLILIVALLGYAVALQARAQQPDPFVQGQCQQDFANIQSELEKRGLALKSAGEKKAPPQEVCRLLRNYTATESMLIKFFQEKQAVCGVPEQVVSQARQNHTKALAMRDQVCKVASAPQAAPPPPSQGLSGALGTSAVGAPPPETAGGSGVFDTLTGNVLRQ
jgi:hypothetical protein